MAKFLFAGIFNFLNAEVSVNNAGSSLVKLFNRRHLAVQVAVKTAVVGFALA